MSPDLDDLFLELVTRDMTLAELAELVAEIVLDDEPVGLDALAAGGTTR